MDLTFQIRNGLGGHVPYAIALTFRVVLLKRMSVAHDRWSVYIA
jgi:hypothetical protein